MQLEKKKGISINSVARNFKFNSKNFNLIDTPGHSELQFEVNRSLAVLDLAIIVVDCTKGVEAQTYTYFKRCQDFK